jgi:hypothetical protein
MAIGKGQQDRERTGTPEHPHAALLPLVRLLARQAARDWLREAETTVGSDESTSS